jgi:hypothetical protein
VLLLLQLLLDRPVHEVPRRCERSSTIRY